VRLNHQRVRPYGKESIAKPVAQRENLDGIILLPASNCLALPSCCFSRCKNLERAHCTQEADAEDCGGKERFATIPAGAGAEVVELPRGARLHARTSDISRSGCYIDTLNPIPQGPGFACSSHTITNYLRRWDRWSKPAHYSAWESNFLKLRLSRCADSKAG
jgi:hypothetical protein